ncbi:hypothetical protein E2L05_00700 [Meridianimarinicoccus aquatilis]|uniref:Uncharacterized protein n=1 Tax=Meridianimarinicoccus aquatilis TaxID=2552766 RepID=A0A4R6B5W1_9RHOB|nr:hypothetical protein E2L05_00700 [Fluviibacterium aquatile]
MRQDWILDVLADLRTFARQNSYSALAEQLDDTLIVAASELKSGDRHFKAGQTDSHERQAGSAHIWAGGSEIT